MNLHVAIGSHDDESVDLIFSHDHSEPITVHVHYANLPIEPFDVGPTRITMIPGADHRPPPPDPNASGRAFEGRL